MRTDAAVEFVEGVHGVGRVRHLVGIDPDDHDCSFLLAFSDGKAAVGMPTFRPDERDLTSVEPDRHRSLIGR